MKPAERVVLERARVARLATVAEAGQPHAVPICYAVVGDRPRLVSPIDEKPKSTRDLQRLRDIRANPRVAIVVDRYSEDWSELAWVQVRGRASVLDPGDEEHERAVTALRSKYEQYADHDLDTVTIVDIGVDRTLSWGALEAFADALRE